MGVGRGRVRAGGEQADAVSVVHRRRRVAAHAVAGAGVVLPRLTCIGKCIMRRCGVAVVGARMCLEITFILRY